MMNKRKLIMAAAVLALVLACTAIAQVDPGMKLGLYENNVKVGEMYLNPYATGQTTYVQNWVLSPGYQYPGPRFLGALQVIASPTDRPYASEMDFFQNVPWSTGSKYVRITSEEFTSLPGRR